MARCAGAIWQLEQHLAVLPPLEPVRYLGASRDRLGRGDGRQRTPQHRQHDHPGPSAGRRRKRGTREQAFGRSRGGFTSKVHCLADARGRPLAFHLTGGEAADCKAYEVLIDLPAAKPKFLLADKAYDTDPIRFDLKMRRIRAVIPPKSNRTRKLRWNKQLYRERCWIECNVGHLKANRSIATRYDKTAESFLGMLYLGAIKIWMKFVHRA